MTLTQSCGHWRTRGQNFCDNHVCRFLVAYRLVGLVVKASASRAEGPGSESRLRRVIPVTSKLALQWLPCQAPGSVGSVSLTTPCHLTFLTFFFHTNHLERCALLTPLCFQFLASVWRSLAEDLSLLLAQLSGIPYLCLPEKLNVFQLSKRS